MQSAIQPSAQALLSVQSLDQLRADPSLGSGNFFDRCLALSHAPTSPFLFLDRPIVMPDGTALHSLGLAELQRLRISLASWYLELGVQRGAVVPVCVEDGLFPFLHYLALTSLGAAIALVNPAMPAAVGGEYFADNGFDMLITDDATARNSELVKHLATCSSALSIIKVPPPRARHEPMPAWWPVPPEDSTLVMLSHTSGTTGVPKAVRFEHRQFFMGKRARIGRFAEGADERLLSALPQSHSSAISHLETAVLHGIPTLVLGSQEGTALRDAIARFLPTTVVAFPKSFALLVEAGVADNEFPSIRRWFSMGDAAHQSHTRRLLAGAPSSRFIDAFGSSELGMALFRSESTADSLAPRRSIGRPVDIAVAKVLDARTGEEVADGQVGLLAVRAPTITSGYWRKPAQTRDAWKGGYFLTGDVAFCKDGNYYQIDRQVDVIDTSDGPLFTLLLEEAAQQLAGVCDVSVVGLRSGQHCDRIFAAVLPERAATQSPSDLAEAVLACLHACAKAADVQLPSNAVTVAIIQNLDWLPLGATGKVLKRRLRELAARVDADDEGGAASPLLLWVRRGPFGQADAKKLPMGA